MLIFLDLETTGLEMGATICSIGLVYEKSSLYELVNEGKKIPAEASSIHHITNEQIQGKGRFTQSNAYQFLQEHNREENILVLHNMAFILDKLEAHGMEWRGGIVDTLRVSKHLIPECDLFGLQVLRYELMLYKREEKLQKEYGIKDAFIAHHALSDTFILKLLFEYHLESVDVAQMQSLSFQHVLLDKFSFGKYKGKYIEEVCFNDRAYVEWLYRDAKELDADLRYSLEYYLRG